MQDRSSRPCESNLAAAQGPYASIGDREQALQFLDEAVQQHDGNLLFCKVNPWFDPLQSDRRSQAFLRRTGIPE